jgi:hypothetical protein
MTSAPVTTINALTTWLLLAGRRQMAGERRDERRAHRAFGKQVAQQIGNPEGDLVGVSRETGAKVRGDHLLADNAENSAGDGRGTGRRGRPRERG